MIDAADSGIVEIASIHSVDETVDRLKGILAAKGITLFATIDHSGEAEKAGLAMPPTKLLIFGSPRAGTPIMLASPLSAIDLPLKILVRQGADSKAYVSYNSLEFLRARHDIPGDLIGNLAAIESLAVAAAK
ncbi:MAG: DUF302 domain-containing protein [Terracidiphilus sp.]